MTTLYGITSEDRDYTPDEIEFMVVGLNLLIAEAPQNLEHYGDVKQSAVGKEGKGRVPFPPSFPPQNIGNSISFVFMSCKKPLKTSCLAFVSGWDFPLPKQRYK